VDKRADIWAFGCVLYEMLTGNAPFAQQSDGDLVAAILREEPDWQRLPKNLSAPIVALVKRCLEKNRAHRLPDMSVVQFLLGQPSISAITGAIVTEGDATGAKRRLRFEVAAVAVAFALALVAAVTRITRPTPTIPPTRLMIVPAPEAPLGTSENYQDIAVSPDGSRVVYVGTSGRLFVRALDALNATPLGGLGDPLSPFFSPDGQSVGFFDANGSLRRVAVTGGSSTKLAGLDGAFPRGGTWSEDGTIVFATTASSGLLSVSASGGPVQELTTPDRTEGDHVLPQFLPGGHMVLFTILPARGTLDGAQIAVLDLATRTYKVVVSGGSHGRYLPSGHLVYATGGTLRAVPFDVKRLAVAATPPLSVIDHAVIASSGAANFDVSQSGVLAYVSGASGPPSRTLLWVDRRGREESLGVPPREYLYPRISPDGTRVALDIRDQSNDIWMWDLARKTLTRVTTHPGLDRFPLWMPDGKLIFTSDRAGVSNLFTQLTSEVGTPEQLVKAPHEQVPMSVTSDGRRILVRDGINKLVLLTLENEHVESLIDIPFNVAAGAISPNERWLAYVSNESSRFQIYVRPFPNVNAERWQISTAGGAQPLWSRDSGELFFFADSGELMSAQIDRSTAWAASTPVVVVKSGYRQGNQFAAATYDISRDGRRFLMIKSTPPATGSSAPTIVVVQNWFEELKQRVPTK
jgi:serine/threonine-protein kinase